MRFWKGFSRIKVHLIPWLTREVWGTETGIPHLKSGRTRTRGQASSLQALGCLLISTSPAALHRGSQCGRRPTAPRTREGSSSSGLLSDSPREGRRRGLLASPSHPAYLPTHCALCRHSEQDEPGPTHTPGRGHISVSLQRPSEGCAQNRKAQMPPHSQPQPLQRPRQGEKDSTTAEGRWGMPLQAMAA